MGNCKSEEVHHAIKQDGQQNVKYNAVLSANQKFIDNYVQQIKPIYMSELKKSQELKLSQIADSRTIVEKMFTDKKIEIQTQETGTVEYFETKHNKSFQILSGYTQAVSRINDFQNRVKQIYNLQNYKLPQDLEVYKKDLKFQMEKLKWPLPSLTAFRSEDKEKILEEVAKHNHKQVQKSNKRLQQQFQSQYSFKQLHQKRFQQKVPSSQLNEILGNFENSLSNIHSKKSNFFSCF